jgi:hypothetical protein
MGKYLPYAFYEKRPASSAVFLAALILAAGAFKP